MSGGKRKSLSNMLVLVLVVGAALLRSMHQSYHSVHQSALFHEQLEHSKLPSELSSELGLHRNGNSKISLVKETIKRNMIGQQPIYFIVTASLGETITILPGQFLPLDKKIRMSQYRRCITRLVEVTARMDAKIIIVEGNGKRKTELDEFGLDVFYTNNNRLKTGNKGMKEHLDILDCMTYYNITDSDFVVKMTGRYFVHYNSSFIKIVAEPNFQQDAVIKFGSFLKPVDYQMEDCITGLIGMRARYIRSIRVPQETEAIEWCWARASYMIRSAYLTVIQGPLGLDICPASNTYFSV